MLPSTPSSTSSIAINPATQLNASAAPSLMLPFAPCSPLQLNDFLSLLHLLILLTQQPRIMLALFYHSCDQRIQ